MSAHPEAIHGLLPGDRVLVANLSTGTEWRGELAWISSNGWAAVYVAEHLPLRVMRFVRWERMKVVKEEDK